MFITPTTMAYSTLSNVMDKNMKPPILLPDRPSVCNLTRSSLVLGNSPTNNTPLTWSAVVNIVSLVMPDTSPEANVSFDTSQIPSIIVLIAELRPRAELFTVVNMAYDAPSLPVGHRCTIIIVVGRN